MARLGIDASNSFLSIAIFKDKILLSESNVECKRNLSEIILSEIDKCLQEANISKKDLSEIIATNGPGSYTALRVVLSVAKTLAYSLNIELKIISSLRLQAATGHDFNGVVVPLIDGRRGNVYAACYKNNEEILKENYYSLEEVIEFLNKQNEPVLFTGNDVNNFNLGSLIVNFELNDDHIKANNIIYVEDFVKESDFYNALPSYLRLTEAERNLENDKNR